MYDLKNAIKNLVENSEDSNWVNEETGTPIVIVDDDLLEILVAEYNIHFVEPNEPQLKSNTWRPFK